MESVKKQKYFLYAIIILVLGYFTSAGFPSFAENKAEKCEYHGINADICTRCNSELIPEFKASGDWCASHNVAESQCDLCNYGAIHEASDEHEDHDHDHDTDDYGTDLPIKFDSEEHDHETNIEKSNNYKLKPKSEILVYFPENVIKCATDEAVIQLASIKTAERSGFSFSQAVTIESSPYIEAPAEIVFNETKISVISTIIPSLVSQWLVEPGQKVVKGTLLARLSSPDIPGLKANYLESYAAWNLAKNHYKRQKDLFAKQLISDSDFEVSETEFAVAEAQLTGKAGMLISAGLSNDDLQKIISEKIIDHNLNIYSPEDGVIIKRIAQPGQLLDKGLPLAIIGDPDSLWIEAQVRQEDAPYFSLGDRLYFSSDGDSFKKCGGQIIWKSQFLDEESRSVTIRAKIESISDEIHSGEFGRVTVDCRDKSEMVLVPKDAVQWEGCCNVVFVRESIDRFRPRKVSVIPGANGYYNILNGLKPGEEFVVDGSYLLKTELRKGSIGAGCCGI